MNILITGLPYFSKKLTLQLNSFTKFNNKYFYLDYSGIKGKVTLLYYLCFIDRVYLIGGAFSRSWTVELALFFRKKVIFHWVGTDALNALDMHKQEQTFFYKNKVRSLCEVKWIQEELRCVEIDADIVSLASIKSVDKLKNQMPNEFMLLAYIGKGRREFYGLHWIEKLSHDMPQIKIKVAGDEKGDSKANFNCEFLGWVSNIDELYQSCSVYVRIPKHDGLAFSVLEALSHGKHVVYTYSFPCCIKVDDYDSFKSAITELYNKHIARKLELNKAAIDFIENDYSATRVLSALEKELIS